MIEGTEASSRAHGRRHTVDSLEVYELLADGESISDLSGYGTLTWIDTSAPNEVRMVRLTSDGPLAVARTLAGGCVWASTDNILSTALATAGVDASTRYRIDVGTVYVARADGLYETTDRLTLRDRWSYWEDDDDDDDDERRKELIATYGLDASTVAGMDSDAIEDLIWDVWGLDASASGADDGAESEPDPWDTP
jgi:hypothetical protein